MEIILITGAPSEVLHRMAAPRSSFCASREGINRHLCLCLFLWVFFTFKMSTQIQGRGPLARHKIKLFLFLFFLAHTARVKSTWVLIVFVSLKKTKKRVRHHMKR